MQRPGHLETVGRSVLYRMRWGERPVDSTRMIAVRTTVQATLRKFDEQRRRRHPSQFMGVVVVQGFG
jgi:hypothetical protein